jgi:hypothetical protein
MIMRMAWLTVLSGHYNKADQLLSVLTDQQLYRLTTNSVSFDWSLSSWGPPSDCWRTENPNSGSLK